MLNSIHSDLIRGHIDTIILSVLHEGDRYGYDILGEIERKSGGEYVLKQPTLYSCLKRLETQGFIYKYWGTETNGGRRTYYSLTEMGKELFQRNKDEWKYSRSVIDKLISSPADPNVIIETVEIPAEAENGRQPASAPTDITETIEPVAVDEVAEDATAVIDKSADASPSIASDDQETTTIITEAADIGNFAASDRPPDEYADVVAAAEKDEILAASAATEYAQQIKGVSYSDRLAHEENSTAKRVPDPSEINGTPFFAHDYFNDRDEELEDADEAYEAAADEDRQEDIKASYPERAFYKDEDFASDDSEQLSMFDDPAFRDARRKSERSFRAQENEKENAGVFKSYENAELSEETNREIVVGREYLGIIKRLLSGDTDADTYYSKLREVGATTASETASERESVSPVEEQPQIVTEPRPEMPAEASETNGADFDDLLVSVRSMGDEIRIRTHNRALDKEYNSLYHFYANKLLLFKYGILFAVMILEIIIPYFVIKFGLNITPIAGELPVLVLAVVGAALLPIYAVSAFLIDPYKRKRYDFDLKNSLLYRLGIMLLMLILVYAVNVVFYMDISLEAGYAFSLITPALLSTNIPLSAIVFKMLYDSKRFSAE